MKIKTEIKKSKIFLFVSILLVALLIISGLYSAQEKQLDNILVQANSFTITEKDFQEQLISEGRENESKEAKSAILEDMILTHLLSTETATQKYDQNQLVLKDIGDASSYEKATEKRKAWLNYLFTLAIKEANRPNEEQLEQFYEKWEPGQLIESYTVPTKESANKVKDLLETGRTSEEVISLMNSGINYTESRLNTGSKVDILISVSINQMKDEGDVSKVISANNQFTVLRLKNFSKKTTLEKQRDEVLEDYMSFQDTFYNRVFLIEELVVKENVQILTNNYGELLKTYSFEDPVNGITKDNEQ